MRAYAHMTYRRRRDVRLRSSHPDRMAIKTRQQGLEAPARSDCGTVIRKSLRMRHSRVIVGEVHAEGCLDLLLALNAGPPPPAAARRRPARRS